MTALQSTVDAPKCARKRTRIWFSFADPKEFSGQKAATLLVIDGLKSRCAECKALPLPVLDRAAITHWELLRYAGRVLRSWIRSCVLLVQRGAWLHVSIGQTRFAFLRDSVPLILGRIGMGRQRVVITLNGSLFMQWKPRSLNAKFFGALLRQAGTVTVLGRRQREQLIALGVPTEAVQVVPNACDLQPLFSDEMQLKMSAVTKNGPIRLLYLSSLITTKGYPEYLDALLDLSGHPGQPIEAVLCGRLVASEFSDRFTNLAEAEKWIEDQMAEINASSRVRVCWIRGAAGAEKAALYRAADIFVLPTRYPVEAQPLVLVEAMATGCAIITTTVGEIKTILDEHTALFLPEAQPDALTASVTRLIEDHDERKRLASTAHARFLDKFQLSKHLDTWESIFGMAQRNIDYE